MFVVLVGCNISVVDETQDASRKDSKNVALVGAGQYFLLEKEEQTSSMKCTWQVDIDPSVRSISYGTSGTSRALLLDSGFFIWQLECDGRRQNNRF